MTAILLALGFFLATAATCLNTPTAGSGSGTEDIGEARLVADDVQQKVNGELTMPVRTAAIPERHPSMGTSQKILAPAVTNRQVEPQDRGQLDVVLALVVIQQEQIEVILAVND